MEICISISASTPAEYQDALNALNAGIKAPAAPAKPSPAPQAPQQPAVAPQDKLGEILGTYSVRKLSDIPSEHWAEALNEMEENING